MSRQNERQGLLTLTENHFMSVSSFHISDFYRVGFESVVTWQDKVSHVLLTKGMIADRTAKLAHDIKEDFKGERVHLLCVLKVYSNVDRWTEKQGAHTFFAELCNQLTSLGYPYSYEFIRAKSYEGTSSTGNGKNRSILDLTTMSCPVPTFDMQ